MHTPHPDPVGLGGPLRTQIGSGIALAQHLHIHVLAVAQHLRDSTPVKAARPAVQLCCP